MSELAPENGAPVEAPPEPQEPPAPEPSAPEPEAWVGPSREEWEQAQQFQQAATPILQQIATNMGLLNQQQQQPQQQQPPPLDVFDPNSIDQYIDYKVQQRTQPYEPVFQMVEAQQGEQLARAEIARLHETHGAFDDDTALVIASGMLEQGVAPQQALAQAAQLLQQHEEQVRADERQRHGIALQTHAEAAREAPAATGLGQEPQRVPQGKNRYEEAVQNYLANRKPGLPIG